MNILVTNNHLDTYGGSETFCYTLIEELLAIGHYVEYFTFKKGITSERIELELHVKFLTMKKYDLILANHNSCIKYLRKILPVNNTIIQTCHGIYPKLEQPTWLANGHISISKEVQEHLKNKGYNSNIISNGINTERFKPKNKINKDLKKVLSLCQSEKANNEIQEACKHMNIEFHKLNKFKNPIWDVEKKINDVDLVVGIGRSAYEAMSCGRPVIIYDNRPYSESYADGYVTPDIIQQSLSHNMSGRSFKKRLSIDNLKDEFKKYNDTTGFFLRSFTLKNLNISIQTTEYLDQHNHLNEDPSKLVKLKIYSILTNISHFMLYPYYYFKTPEWRNRNFDKKTPTNLKNQEKRTNLK